MRFIFNKNFGSVVAFAFILVLYHFAFGAGSVIGATPVSQGTLPQIISYQGTLTDNNDQPINDTLKLTFNLYNVNQGGVSLWSETHNNISIQNGQFSVLLGSINPISTTVWQNANLYLGIKIGADEEEMSPREQLSGVPMALSVPAQSITETELADEAVSNAKLNLSYWLLNIPGDVVITADDQASANEVTKLDVDFPKDGVYLIVAKIISSSDIADEQLVAEVWDENGIIGEARTINTHPQTDWKGKETGTIVTIHPFSAGPHTIKLMAYMRGSSSDGIVRGATELIVVPLGGQQINQ